MSHRARVYHSLDELLEDCAIEGKEAFWIRKWNQHVEKHGNVPMILKCVTCSGQEMKKDIKRGSWKLGKERRINEY